MSGSIDMKAEVAIIGAGTMGAGIAQVAAVHGWRVQLIDVKPEYVQRGLEGIRKNLDRLVERGKMSAADRDAALGRIDCGCTIADGPHPTLSQGERGNDAGQMLNGAALVIEAIVEDLELKKTTLSQIEAALPSAAVLATNTSSLSVDRIADGLKDPSRLVGMHFFNPAPLMPLVEIIAGRRSDPAAVDFAFTTAVQWGKVAVRAKDTPGFIVNRVARGYYLEALRLLGEGVAGVDEIDRVMRGGGFKMGPFELMDLVGLDVNLAVSTSVWEQMQRHPRFEPHDIQKRLVAAGRLGRKTGRGFYVYDRDPPLPAVPVDRKSYSLSPLLVDAIRAFVTRGLGRKEDLCAPHNARKEDLCGPQRREDGGSQRKENSGPQRKEDLCGPLGSTEQYVFARMLAAVINEAGLALDEGVATRVDIDLAMVKGTNYPKGPLAWADEIGVRTVRGVLNQLNLGSDRKYPLARALDAST